MRAAVLHEVGAPLRPEHFRLVGPEGPGVVEAVGAGVERVRAGDTAVAVGRAVVLPGR
jgi:NADPH:quinone reductase-like Zn-dependent oxidoreductase